MNYFFKMTVEVDYGKEPEYSYSHHFLHAVIHSCSPVIIVRMYTVPVDVDEKIKVLSQNLYFEGLDEFILQQLAQDTVLRKYKRGEILFWQDEPCTGLYIIQSGSVKLFKLSPKGREHIINVLDEDTSFSEVPVFDHRTNPVNAAALEDSMIWIVGADTIRRLTMEYPQMAQAVILNLCSNLRMLVGKLEELSFYQVSNRLARLISKLSSDQHSGAIKQRMTQDELAARLGTVREVVARSLKDLEQSGAIQVDRSRIQVKDENQLLEWIQGPD